MARYKTSAGMDPVLLAQLPIVEDALEAMGVTVWAMVEHEADDALAAAAQWPTGTSEWSRCHRHSGQGSRPMCARDPDRPVRPAQ